MDGSFRRIREKWNFKYRKECFFWQLHVLPNDPQWLGHQNISQFVIHSLSDFSTTALALRYRYLLCEVSGSVSLIQDSVKAMEGGLRSQTVHITC